MKKTLFMAAAVVMTLAACSNDEDAIKINKGMTLTANVENTETRATLDKNEETSKWDFNWTAGDAVSITSPSKTPYIFTCDGTKFSCETAEPAVGTWTAVYPTNYETEGVNFIGQPGTMEYVAEHMPLVGTENCAEAKGNLNMTMVPQLAVLALTNNSGTKDAKYGIRDANKINFYQKMNADGTFAMNTQQGMSYIGEFSEIGQTMYFLVPAGVPIVIKGKNGFTTAKTLEAGKVYNLTINFR